MFGGAFLRKELAMRPPTPEVRIRPPGEMSATMS
jgi:hypothetical protein